MTRAALFLLAAMTLMACPTRVAVGLECTSRDQCEAGQDCFPTPDGFCSKGCSEAGQTRECPAGTVCTTFYGTTQVCSPTCEGSGDCREGFSCTQAGPGAELSACQPLAAQ